MPPDRSDHRRVRLTPDIYSQATGNQAGVITSAQLRVLGADNAWVSRQVRSGQWQRLHRGVLVTHSGPIGWNARASGALLYAGPGAVLSHQAAAFLHGFRTTPPSRLDVCVPESRRVMPAGGIVLHGRTTMPPASGSPRRVWRGDTVLDLVGGSPSVDDAVGWICDALRAGTCLLEVTDAAARRGRFRHSRLLRELLTDASAGIESPLERRYHRDVEQRHGLPSARFQVRQVVDGLWIRADRVYDALGVRVELDGELAHPGGRTDRDTWRDNAVVIACGEITLRYRWRHVAARPCRTAVQVAAALHSRGWTGRVQPCGASCALRDHVGSRAPLRRSAPGPSQAPAGGLTSPRDRNPPIHARIE